MAIKSSPLWSLLSLQTRRSFSRKGVPIKEILQMQKTKIDESEHDMFHMLTKNADILDKMQAINRATSDEDRVYRQQQGLKALNAMLQREYAHEL